MTGYTTPRPLAADDNLDEFDSGEVSLDTYLRQRAWSNHTGDAARCYVATHSGRVVGYYALATASINRSTVAGKIRRNMPDPVPAILLTRLAVDAKHQGEALGKNLLRDAILRAVAAADIAGIRVLLVHALHDQAAAFYARFGFEPAPTDPLHLMLLVYDARESISHRAG